MTIDELGAALRLTTGEPVEEPTLSILERQLATARELVNAYAPSAPDTTLDSAIIRVCGYLYDAPNTALNNAPQVDILRLSGATSLLSPWHVF